MTIKSILAPLTNATAKGFPLDTALLVANALRAHAEVLFIKEEVRENTRMALIAAGRPEVQDALRQLAASTRQEQESGHRLARQKFDDLLARHRIDYRENSIPGDLPSAFWRVASGTAIDEIEQHGSAYDLIVVPRPEENVASQPIVEAALFGTGCPVLVAPPKPPKIIGEHVMIGWNQGVPAAHAVRYAMPFLEIASRVEVFSVSTGAKRGTSAPDIARYLSWHGVKAELNSASPDQRSVGETLLSRARESGADLLVLGAFSHSRLRQLVLGGVTRHVLKHADIPVLMAH